MFILCLISITITIREIESRKYQLAKRATCSPRMMWCKFAGKFNCHVLGRSLLHYYLSSKLYLGCQCDGDRCFGCSSRITKRSPQRGSGSCTEIISFEGHFKALIDWNRLKAAAKSQPLDSAITEDVIKEAESVTPSSLIDQE